MDTSFSRRLSYEPSTTPNRYWIHLLLQAALFQEHLEPLVKARMASDDDLTTVGLMQAPPKRAAGGGERRSREAVRP